MVWMLLRLLSDGSLVLVGLLVSLLQVLAFFARYSEEC